MFRQEFDSFVCAGDSITCVVDGLTFVAILEHDHDCTPMDYDGPGCCFDTEDPEYGAENEAIIEAWRNDEWHYFGLRIEVYRGFVKIEDHAASLWEIEGNFPNGDNSYFLDVANELLPEAHAMAEIALQEMRDELAA